MKYKKIIASILCVAFTAGFAGCDNTKKDREAISEIIDQCEDAFKDDDAEAFLELTNWDEDDDKYQVAEELMNFDYSDEYFIECYNLIFDTIEIDYDVDDIEVDGKKASVKVKYEVLDWSDINYQVSTMEITYMDAIKNTKKTSSIKGKIEFELEKGEWKISRITDLDSLFSFKEIINTTEYIPTPPPDPTATVPTVSEPDPTDTEPSASQPSGTTAFPDSYGKAMASFKTILEQNNDAIELTDSIFGINTVGFYDFDGNGIPEMYFFSNDSGDYSAALHIYEYGEYSGEAMEVVSFDEVVTQGQAGNFAVFATDKELVITNTYGETFTLTVNTNVFTLENTSDGFYKWDLTGNYSRNLYTDYDPETDVETTTYTYYKFGTEVTEDQYMKEVKDLVGRAVIQLGRMYTFTSNDPEYKLISLPSNSTMGYGMAIEYVESQI